MTDEQLKLISPQTVEDLFHAGCPQAVVDELHAFGAIMLSEVEERLSGLDNKLLLMLGWAGAVLAFLLFGPEVWVRKDARFEMPIFWLSLIGLAAAAMALFYAHAGARVRTVPAPSEVDWFRSELFRDYTALPLRQYHVLSMLHFHQGLERIIEQKGSCARSAQTFLSLSFALLGAAAFLGLFG